MAMYELGGIAPELGAGAWVADSADVMGDVVLGENASVWFGAVVRGDVARISIGKNSNVQDASVLHVDHGVPLVIGADVTIGDSMGLVHEEITMISSVKIEIPTSVFFVIVSIILHNCIFPLPESLDNAFYNDYGWKGCGK